MWRFTSAAHPCESEQSLHVAISSFTARDDETHDAHPGTIDRVIIPQVSIVYRNGGLTLLYHRS